MEDYGALFSDFWGAARDFVGTTVEQVSEVLNPATPLEKNLKEALGSQQHGCSTAVLGELTKSMAYGGDSTLDVVEAITKVLELPPYRAKEHLRALTLIEFMIGHGNAFVMEEIRAMRYLVQKVQSYTSGTHGTQVRDKAMHVIQCMEDEECLEKYRLECADKSSKYTGISSMGVALSSSQQLGPTPPSSKMWDMAAHNNPNNFGDGLSNYYVENNNNSNYHSPTRRNGTRPIVSNNKNNNSYPGPSFSSYEENSNLPPQLNTSMFAPPRMELDPLKDLKCPRFGTGVGRYSMEEESSEPYYGGDDYAGKRRYGYANKRCDSSGSVEVFAPNYYNETNQQQIPNANKITSTIPPQKNHRYPVRNAHNSQYNNHHNTAATSTMTAKSTWFEQERETMQTENPFEEDVSPFEAEIATKVLQSIEDVENKEIEVTKPKRPPRDLLSDDGAAVENGSNTDAEIGEPTTDASKNESIESKEVSKATVAVVNLLD